MRDREFRLLEPGDEVWARGLVLDKLDEKTLLVRFGGGESNAVVVDRSECLRRVIRTARGQTR